MGEMNKEKSIFYTKILYDKYDDTYDFMSQAIY